MTIHLSTVNAVTGYKTEPIGGSRPGQAAGEEVDGKAPSAEQKQSEGLKRALESIQAPDTMVERSMDEKTRSVVYKIKDKKSGELIRQIPEEKLLEMAARAMENQGILIDKKI